MPCGNLEQFEYMNRAIELARQGLFTTDPNPRVGCVIVNNGRVVGEGFHAKAGEPHAEVHALQQAGDAAKNATVYVSLEPCSHHGRTPPCAEALVKAGVRRVVVAHEDPNPQVAGKGVALLRDAGVHVEVGVLAEEAQSLNPGFIKRMQIGLPLVRAKVAMSLDGKTALANGESQWITSAEARADVHSLRARSSAMVTGIGTVLADDPKLNARIENETVHQPMVVVLDSQGRLPEQASVLKTGGGGIHVVAEGAHGIDLPEHWQRWRLPSDNDGLNLLELLKRLGNLECNEVMVEAGGKLVSSFLKHDLLDELVVYQAPLWMGEGAQSALQLGGFDSMQQAPRFVQVEQQFFGQDVKRVFAIKKGH